MKEKISLWSLKSEEPYFSWYDCELCGSSLGGNRYDIDFCEEPNGPVFELSICVDCLEELAYGKDH